MPHICSALEGQKVDISKNVNRILKDLDVSDDSEEQVVSSRRFSEEEENCSRKYSGQEEGTYGKQ